MAAQPLTYADLLFPRGPLREEMYRGVATEDVQTALERYAGEGETELGKRLGNGYTDDELEANYSAQRKQAKLWALYLAYTDLAGQAAGLPTQASEVNLQASYPVNYAKQLLELANRYKSDFEAGFVTVEEAVGQIPGPVITPVC